MLMYRPSDRIKVTFMMGTPSEFTASFAPLSVADKTRLMGMVGSAQEDSIALFEFAKTVLKTTVKSVEGIKLTDGSSWELKFDSGIVTEESIMELLNTEVAESLTLVGSLFLRGVPKEGEVIDPRSNKPIEGVVVKKGA